MAQLFSKPKSYYNNISLITLLGLPSFVPFSSWLFNNRTHVLFPSPPQLIFHECRLWRKALRRFTVITPGNCFPHTSMRGMSDVLHIKLCAGYEPTNNAMAFGLLAVIPVNRGSVMPSIMMLFSGWGHLNRRKCSDSKAPLQ